MASIAAAIELGLGARGDMDLREGRYAGICRRREARIQVGLGCCNYRIMSETPSPIVALYGQCMTVLLGGSQDNAKEFQR